MLGRVDLQFDRQARTVIHRAGVRRSLRSVTMEASFKVGSIVMQRAGSPRMKVVAIEGTAGRIRCTWTQGPAKYSQIFDAKDLIVSAMHPVTYQPPARRG